MSIRSKNSLAVAGTVLAVLGLLAAIQLSAPPPESEKDKVRTIQDGRHQSQANRSRYDSRIVEYQ